MIVALAWIYVRTPAEFEAAGAVGSKIAILANLTIPTDFQPFQLLCELEGNGHVIITAVALFTTMESAILHNITIITSQRIALNVLATLFHSVFITTSSNVSPFDQLSSAQLKSVHYDGTVNLAMRSLSSEFYGSAFELHGSNIEEANISGVVHFSDNDKFSNSYFHSEVEIEGCQFFGGVMIIAKLTTLKNCNAVINITNINGDGTQIGGLAAEAEASAISGCDVLTISKGTIFGNIGGATGLMLCENSNNITMMVLNSSVSLQLTINEEDNRNAMVCSYGGVSACSNGQCIEFAQVSVFLQLEINFSVNETANMGGIEGSDELGAVYINCYVFGHISSNSKAMLYAGGIVGHLSGANKSSIKACSTNTVWNVALEDKSHVGGFGGMLEDMLVVQESESLGSLVTKLSNTIDGDVFVGGFSGSLSGVASNCYSVMEMEIECGAENATLMVGGFTGEFATGTLEFCLIMTSHIKIYASEVLELLAGGFIALLSGENIEVRDSYVILDVFTVKSSSREGQLKIGGFAGVMSVAEIDNTFVRANITCTSSELTLVASFVVSADISSKIVGSYASCSFTGVKDVAFIADNSLPSIAAFADCSKQGNDIEQIICKSDCQSSQFADELGGEFAFLAELNDAYPYLTRPAIPISRALSLSDSETLFPPNRWYEDKTGLIFTKSGFEPCRSACYGEYASPNDYICEITLTNDNYCISSDGSADRLKNKACAGSNACINGVSHCLPSEEIKGGICQNSCSGCANGVCVDRICRCYPYFKGAGCDQFDCGQGDIECFGAAKCMPDSHYCRCSNSHHYVDAASGLCTLGCDGDLDSKAYCVGQSRAYCKSAVREASECEYVGLSVPAIIGIAIGSAMLLVVIFAVTFVFIKRHRKLNPRLYNGVNVDRITIEPEIEMI